MLNELRMHYRSALNELAGHLESPAIQLRELSALQIGAMMTMKSLFLFRNFPALGFRLGNDLFLDGHGDKIVV